MDVCSTAAVRDGNSQSDFDFSVKTDHEHLCMTLNRRMQHTTLRALHDGGDNFCDVTLFGVPPPGVESSALHPIRSHKIILAFASKHLYDLFTVDGFIDSHQSEYHLEVVDHEHLRRIVECIYTDQLSIPAANAVAAMCGVLIGADYLGVKNIADACELFLADSERVKPENCVKLWCFARKYGCLTLMHATMTLIMKHLADMPQNTEFLCMEYRDCAKLLMSEALCTADADQRCLAAIAWLNYDSSPRVPFVRDIVNMVPLTYGSVCAGTIYEAHQSQVLREHASETIQNLTSSILKQITSTESVCTTGSSCYPHWYVIGGKIDQFMHYDAGRRMWTKFPDLSWNRTVTSAVVIKNQLTVMGGRKNGHITDDIEQYDWQTGTWTTSCVKLSMARESSRACSVGRYAYVIGGDDGSHELNIVERWDAESETVIRVAPMTWRRSYFASASVKGCNDENCIFMAGGYETAGSIEKYNICTNKWSKVGHMVLNRRRLAGTISGDDFYLVGGQTKEYASADRVEVFNMCTGQIRTAPSLTKARIGCSAATLYQGNVICVMGGYVSLESSCTVDCLDTREGKWSTGYIVPDMLVACSDFGLAVK